MNETFAHLKNELIKNNSIDSQYYQKFDVKRGLRNRDGSGVLAGLSHISSVIGFHKIEGDMHPVDGDLKYRGHSICQLIKQLPQQTFIFEQVLFLLLVGRIPTKEECSQLCTFIQQNKDVPEPIINLLRSPIKTIRDKIIRVIK